MTILASINLFAGAGGSCLGHYLATGRYIDVAVNHDPVAVEVHAFNNPHTEHYVQNIFHVSPRAVAKGRPVGFLWASPDCTYHSIARGSAPIRDVQRRDLPFVVSGVWLPALMPIVFMMENVKEILDWGPLDADGRIVESAKGDYWRSFVRQIRRLGYKVEWRILKACDYGVATTRERLYLAARRDGRPIVWPEATHGAPGSLGVLSGELQPYRTAAEFIDWSLPCPSIFDTAAEIKAKHGLIARRPLKDASLRRIARGMNRFVLDNPRPFVVHYFGDKGQEVFRGAGVDDPLSAVTAGGNRHGLVVPAVAPFTWNITHSTSGDSRNAAANAPLGTILTKPEHALTVANLVKYYGTGGAVPVDAPLDVCTTKPRFGVTLAWLAKQRGTTTGQCPGQPLHTVTAGGNHFAAVYAFLQQYNGKSFGHMPDEPLHTIRCREAFGVVLCHVEGQCYVISDVGMRMLQPYEQAGCMGFPVWYRLDKTSTGPVTKEDQNRLIGNAVCPDMARILIAANPVHDESAAWEVSREWQPTFWPSREAAMGMAL